MPKPDMRLLHDPNEVRARTRSVRRVARIGCVPFAFYLSSYGGFDLNKFRFFVISYFHYSIFILFKI